MSAAGAAPFDADAIEAGRRLFAAECRFVAGAATASAVPHATLPEVAFVGRSNVGKSSLVNALTGRRTLARVSREPGRTQQINFFSLADRLMLVDLPGYGYARAAKTKVRDWQALARDYLRGRPSLRRALVLIDARHGLKPPDRETFESLTEAAVSFQAVLTKSDLVQPAELAQMIATVAAEIARYTAAHPDVPATSAETGAGIPELRAALAQIAVAG
jgi:GTP-binding protein